MKLREHFIASGLPEEEIEEQVKIRLSRAGTTEIRELALYIAGLRGVPVSETVGVLDKMLAAGKIKFDNGIIELITAEEE
tara:strand:- start:288 stop:527 length:240 start_codon:yes stop_codon:yes gene_type:complete